MKTTVELNKLNIELIRRYANTDADRYERGLEWIASTQLTQVTTQTAFQLARGGRDVMCIDEDADYPLEVGLQDEYYPDKSKTYPEIETIFVVEGVL